MKKAHKGVLYVGVFLCLTHVSMAKDGFSLGGVVAFDNKHVGGGFEVGFPLLQKGFTIRNHISVFSYAAENTNSLLLLQEKIAFGGARDSNMARLYGFISGSFGLTM